MPIPKTTRHVLTRLGSEPLPSDKAQDTRRHSERAATGYDESVAPRKGRVDMRDSKVFPTDPDLPVTSLTQFCHEGDLAKVPGWNPSAYATSSGTGQEDVLVAMDAMGICSSYLVMANPPKTVSAPPGLAAPPGFAPGPSEGILAPSHAMPEDVAPASASGNECPPQQSGVTAPPPKSKLRARLKGIHAHTNNYLAPQQLDEQIDKYRALGLVVTAAATGGQQGDAESEQMVAQMKNVIKRKNVPLVYDKTLLPRKGKSLANERPLGGKVINNQTYHTDDIRILPRDPSTK